MHNGYLQVEGEKMSKSLGNFLTIRDLLQRWPGEVLRLQMLMTQYRQPLDWTDQRCREAQSILDRWYDLAGDAAPAPEIPEELVEALSEDLNTPAALTVMHRIADSAQAGEVEPSVRKAAANFLGLVQVSSAEWKAWSPAGLQIDAARIEELIAARAAARKEKNFAAADRLRDEAQAMGVVLKDGPEGTTWEIER